MDARNNETYQGKKYSKIEDLNEPLNIGEIGELKRLLTTVCSFIGSSYSRKIYDLFINDKIFEPNINNVDDLYYLGVYYQHFRKGQDNDLMKKYYLLAIEKGNTEAMNNLGVHYQWREINYDLAKKYYFMAIEKGNSRAMCNLGCYYRDVEKNYDLMKKYYLQAIEKGNSEAMDNLGYYYERIDKNYDLMKKYYLQAIDKGNPSAMISLSSYYEYIEKNYDLAKKYGLMVISKGDYIVMHHFGGYYHRNMLNDEGLQNYFNAIIKGNYEITYTIFGDDKDIETNKKIDVFCLGIDNINISINNIYCNNIRNFKFCLSKIVNYINSCESCELKNMKHFVKYINRLRYRSKNKQKYKKCVNKIFMKEASQIFIEFLDFYYYKYLEKIFAPGGEGYIKTKKHFELIAKQ
jgi:hypothetical protein